jgi:hypothetical protein
VVDAEAVPAPGEPSRPRQRVLRLDDDFSAVVNRKDVPKSHLTADGSLVPANPAGTTSPLEHIYGMQPAKGNSPYSSFLTESGPLPKAYGAMEVELDVARLQGDVASGRVQNVEVLPPEHVQSMIREDIKGRFPAVDPDAAIARGPAGIESYVESLGLSRTKSGELGRRLLALANTTRDSEWLVRGIIPPEYLSGPRPYVPPGGGPSPGGGGPAPGLPPTPSGP